MKTGASIGILIGTIVASIVGWLLAPIFVDFVGSDDLTAVNYTGEEGAAGEDFSWAGKIAVVFYYLMISLLPLAGLFIVIKSANGGN